MYITKFGMTLLKNNKGFITKHYLCKKHTNYESRFNSKYKTYQEW